MSSTAKLRVGIVGAGGIAQNQHIPGYLSRTDAEIVALCDVNAELLATVGARYQIPRLLDDYRALVALEEVDAVDICTANDSHYPIAMAALDAGKHVFCEKPIAFTYSEAQQMTETARSKGLVTGVGFVHRTTPAARYAHALLTAGKLGRIYHVLARFCAGGTDFAAQPMRWRNRKEVAGAGSLFDLTSHLFDMVAWWLDDDVTALCTQNRVLVPQRYDPQQQRVVEVDAEDASTCLVDFASGAMGTFTSSFAFTGKGFEQRIEIYGSGGALIYDQATPYELRVAIGEEALAQSATGGVANRQIEPYPIIPVPPKYHDRYNRDGKTLRTLTPDFVAAIHENDDFTPTFADGLRVQQLLDAALQSAREERWVHIAQE